MKKRALVLLAVLLSAVVLPASRARAADGEEDFGFEIEEVTPEERARRDRLLRELTLPASWIELGTYWVSDDAYKYGDATGLDDEGFHVLGNFDVRRRAPWDGDETWHLRLRGYNLGLDSRSLHAEYGHQGLFEVWGDFSQIPKFQTDDLWSPYVGIGSPLLTLPPDWVTSDTTAGFTRLDASLRGHRVDWTRDRFGGGLSVLLPFNLEFAARYTGENRHGRKISSAIIGSNGGNPRAAIVAEPIDYKTHEVDATLRFGGERGQLEIGYYFSRFDDQNESLTWQNAFRLGAWDPSASFPTGSGRKSTPPDNVFHQITSAGGYNLPWWNTRVTGDVAFGWMVQEDSFLPYTVNPILDASITRELPRRNLDGQIETTAANFRIDSRPLPRLRLNGRFRYDDRDNDSSRDLYIYIPGDSQRQGTSAGSTARLNRPYSYKLMEYSAEAAYEIFRRTELSFGYRRREIERTFSEVNQTDEDIYTAALRAQPLRWASLRVEGELAERDLSDYVGNRPFLQGTTERHVATIPPDERFENNPDLRKFYLADRDRNRVRGLLTLMPVHWLSLGLAADNVNDQYDDTEIGLLHTRITTYTFDVTLAPCERFTTHAFYTREEFRSRQRGHSFSGNNVLADLADPTRRWRAVDHDDIDTVGWGFDLRLLEGRLTLEGDAVYSRSEGNIKVETAVPPMPVPGVRTAFPTIESDLVGLSLAGRYRVNENLSVRLGYAFERLDVDDWSLDGILPASLPRVLTAGLETPDYRTHVVGLSLIYEFR